MLRNSQQISGETQCLRKLKWKRKVLQAQEGKFQYPREVPIDPWKRARVPLWMPEEGRSYKRRGIPERNPREESLEINWKSREPSEKRISNEELELKIVESEERVETLLEEMSELLEMEEETSGEVAKIEKELSKLEKMELES